MDTAAYANSTVDKHVISKRSIARSLNYSVQVILAGENNYKEIFSTLLHGTLHRLSRHSSRPKFLVVTRASCCHVTLRRPEKFTTITFH